MDGWERPGEGAHSAPAPSLLTGTVWGTSTGFTFLGCFCCLSCDLRPGPCKPRQDPHFSTERLTPSKGSWATLILRKEPAR